MCTPGLSYLQSAPRPNEVLLLKITRVKILAIIALVFLAFILPNPISAEDPVVDFSRDIDPKSMYNPARAIVEINTAEAGIGVYMYMETNISVNVHIINSSAREAILTGGKWGSIYAFVNIRDLDFQFITPYNDTFFILIVNMNRLSAAHVDGWYAFDKTGPSVNVTYDNDDRWYWIGVTASDKFNISKIEIYNDQYLVCEYLYNKYNASLDYKASITLLDSGKNYFTVKVYDCVGNVAIKSFIIYIPEETTTTTSTFNTFAALLLVGIFFGVPVVVVLIIKRLINR